MPHHKNPSPGDHKIHNVGWLFHGHTSIDVDDVYGHILAHEACPGGHEINNFGRLFLGYHYYIHSLSDLCLGVEKKISKEKMHFH